MKYCIIIGLLLLSAMAIHTQNRIEYTYDQAGNRTYRGYDAIPGRLVYYAHTGKK